MHAWSQLHDFKLTTMIYMYYKLFGVQMDNNIHVEHNAICSWYLYKLKPVRTCTFERTYITCVPVHADFVIFLLLTRVT